MNKTAPFIIQARTLKAAQGTPSGNAGQPNSIASSSGTGQPAISQSVADGYKPVQPGTRSIDAGQTSATLPDTSRPGNATEQSANTAPASGEAASTTATSVIPAPATTVPRIILDSAGFRPTVGRLPMTADDWNDEYKNEYQPKIMPALTKMLQHSGVARGSNTNFTLAERVTSLFHPRRYAIMNAGENPNELRIPYGITKYYRNSNLVIPAASNITKVYQYGYFPDQVSRLFMIRPAEDGSLEVLPNVKKKEEIQKYINRYNMLMGYTQGYPLVAQDQLMRSPYEARMNRIEAYGIANAIAHEFQRAALYGPAAKKFNANSDGFDQVNKGMTTNLIKIISNHVKPGDKSEAYYKGLQAALKALRTQYLPDRSPEIAVLNGIGTQMLITELNGGKEIRTSPYPILTDAVTKYSLFCEGLMNAADEARKSSSSISEYEEKLFSSAKNELLEAARQRYSEAYDDRDNTQQIANRLLYLMVTGPSSGLESYYSEPPDIFTRLRRRLAQDKEIRGALLEGADQLEPFNRYYEHLADDFLPAAHFNAAKRYLREINMLALLGQIKLYAYHALDDSANGKNILKEFDSGFMRRFSDLIELASK